MSNTQKRRHRHVRYYALRLYRFLKLDMWRLTPEETPPVLRLFVSIIKVVDQTIRSGISGDLIGRASSLTYSTALSIVPMLAVIVGVAKGFGLQNVVHEALLASLPAQREQLDVVFVYVDNYLNQVQGGLFIGLGLGVLLYTVIILIAGIEDTFNSIWQAPHGRPWVRRILDYLGLFILLPFMLTVSSLLNFISSAVKSTVLGEVELFNTLIKGFTGILPLSFSILIFVGLYMFLPNVRVKRLPAIISGILAGVAYQILQMLYIGGVIWISRYNAIYGSFAAVPLLLLFLQVSWTIALFGAQLSYSIQNIDSFTFGQASEHASRRYRDFVALLIIQRMLLRFRHNHQKPYTVEEISRECRIPLRLTGQLFACLEETGLIREVRFDAEDDSRYYQPGLAPELLTVDYVIRQLDRFGEEDFRVDRQGKYRLIWEAMLSTRGEGEGQIDKSQLISTL